MTGRPPGAGTSESDHQHAQTSDLVRAMEAVAIELLGEPNKARSSRDKLRFGNRGSTSIDLGKGTWFDHEVGAGGGVVDLVQREANLDWSGALNWLRDRGYLAPVDGQARPIRQIVATYPYRDEHDELLFEVVRFEPKDFRQRKPDGAGGWEWKLGGTRRVLFRLPQVMEAVRAGRTVYVAEGEKGVLALVAAGLDGTCSPGGAGKWSKAYNPALTGANVIILPDNDEPGRAHAAQVLGFLRGVAHRVRVVELPGLADKQDVADFFAAGGTWQQIEDLCDDGATDVAPPPESAPTALAVLSAGAWADRDFAPATRLLGNLITTTTRAFFVGATGLGKTMFGLALAAGAASGNGFLDWRCDRPCRVLYLDGEMPGELVRSRVRDAMRRDTSPLIRENLIIYAADTAEMVAAQLPHLGAFGPLNTPDGQRFVYNLIDAVGGVDMIVFDNVMSLVAGDQKDEIPWSDTLPLIAGLTSRQIGQAWLDHAGHNTARQYGSSTKAWRFDAVGIMTALPDDERVVRETAFKLSFDSPGKARRRTPENWHEFAPRTIRLADDVWTSEGGEGEVGGTRQRYIRPDRKKYHDALLTALVNAATVPGTTTVAAWEAACINSGLVDAPEPGDPTKRTRLAKFRTARSELVAAGYVGINGDQASDLVGKYGRF